MVANINNNWRDSTMATIICNNGDSSITYIDAVLLGVTMLCYAIILIVWGTLLVLNEWV